MNSRFKKIESLGEITIPTERTSQEGVVPSQEKTNSSTPNIVNTKKQTRCFVKVESDHERSYSKVQRGVIRSQQKTQMNPNTNAPLTEKGKTMGYVQVETTPNSITGNREGTI
jgi:hypothetical protein